MLKFISFCSGIEAASVAFEEWKPIAYSEIDEFCNTVLAYHYPQVPNLGNLTKVDWSEYRGQADIVVGGPPCQSFSVAGLRKSLRDRRGNITLEYVNAVNLIAPALCFYEQVPGVLNTPDNAFGCLLAGLVGEADALVPPKQLKQFRRGKQIKWANAGLVVGPKRSAAWRVFDAQYFGVPQRRRRLFLIAFDFRNVHRLVGASPNEDLRRLAGIPAAILFEPESVSGDSVSGGKEEEDSARVLAGKFGGSSEGELLGTEGDDRGRRGTRRRAGVGELASIPDVACFQQNSRDEVRLVNGDGSLAGALTAEPGMKQQNYVCYQPSSFGGYSEGIGALTTKTRNNENLVCFTAQDYGDDAGSIAPTLRSGNNKAGNSNSGVMPAIAYCIKGAAIGRKPEAGPQFSEVLEDASYTLNCTENHAVAYGIKDTSQLGRDRHNGIVENQSFTLDTRGKAGVCHNEPSGCLTPCDIQMRRIHGAGGVSPTVCNNGKGGGHETFNVYRDRIVRRLTPTECLRLQGFPDGYLDVPFKGKPVPPDCRMYRANGNSWAIPVVRWLGQRIKKVIAEVRNSF